MQKNPEIIVVRRVDPEDEAPHGGVWKIAHADFMTAMMAFFLIMWLINQSDPATIQSVANYFNPVNLSQSVVELKGLEDRRSAGDQETEKKVDRDETKGDSKGGPAPNVKKPRFQEGTLFQDPYAILARIETHAETVQHDALGADVLAGDSDTPGLKGADAPRDPFDPVYWQIEPIKDAGSEAIAKAGSPSPARDDSINVRSAMSSAIATPIEQPKITAATPPGGTLRQSPAVHSAAMQVNVEAKPPAEASPALTVPDVPSERKPAELQPSGSTVSTELVKLVNDISNAVGEPKTSGQAPNIDVRRVHGGTLISLTDSLGYSMFAIGSAEPDARVVTAMAAIGKVLANKKGQLVVRGHTDGRPFRSKDYDNWRLSQARAQMALYMLVRGGLPESRFARVEGHADRDLRVKNDPNADTNRRIEILIQE